MKFIKHFYYPYYYIETFNGSIISIFFLDNTFHFEDQEDIFVNKFLINVPKKSKKVIEEINNFHLENKMMKVETDFVNDFFSEFFYN